MGWKFTGLCFNLSVRLNFVNYILRVGVGSIENSVLKNLYHKMWVRLIGSVVRRSLLNIMPSTALKCSGYIFLKLQF